MSGGGATPGPFSSDLSSYLAAARKAASASAGSDDEERAQRLVSGGREVRMQCATMFGMELTPERMRRAVTAVSRGPCPLCSVQRDDRRPGTPGVNGPAGHPRPRRVDTRSGLRRRARRAGVRRPSDGGRRPAGARQPGGPTRRGGPSAIDAVLDEQIERCEEPPVASSHATMWAPFGAPRATSLGQ